MRARQPKMRSTVLWGSSKSATSKLTEQIIHLLKFRSQCFKNKLYAEEKGGELCLFPYVAEWKVILQGGSCLDIFRVGVAHMHVMDLLCRIHADITVDI